MISTRGGHESALSELVHQRERFTLVFVMPEVEQNMRHGLKQHREQTMYLRQMAGCGHVMVEDYNDAAENVAGLVGVKKSSIVESLRQCGHLICFGCQCG